MNQDFSKKAEAEQWLNQFNPLVILDSLPENKSFTKDSGRWLIRNDNDEVVMEQKNGETFSDFIKRYALSILQGDDDILREDFRINLASIEDWVNQRLDSYS